MYSIGFSEPYFEMLERNYSIIRKLNSENIDEIREHLEQTVDLNIKNMKSIVAEINYYEKNKEIETKQEKAEQEKTE